MFGSDETHLKLLSKILYGKDIKKRCILNPYELVPLLAYSFCIYKSSFSRGVICVTTSQGMEKEFFWMCQMEFKKMHFCLPPTL